MSRNGRYATLVEPRLDSIKAWRRHGLTEEEVADNLGICRSTLFQYKLEHTELVEAMKTGKDDADALVENALFKRACGYEIEEVETTLKKDGTAIVRKTRKQVAPDTVSMIFYLKNRRAKDWCDRTVKELSGSVVLSDERKELEQKSNAELSEIVEKELERLSRLQERATAGGNGDDPDKN
jgi:hypothetical protein